MNREKNFIRRSKYAGEYTAPKVKVVEVKARRVLCGSLDESYVGDSNNEQEGY